VNYVAKWDGSSWSPLGSGVSSTVYALAVFDDGTGDALYVGGAFSTAGGAAVDGIAKWDGTSWTPLAVGLDSSVSALAVFDAGLGDGPALIAGGNFTISPAGDQHLARWQGCAGDSCAPDMNFDSIVDGSDLAIVLGHWGPCAGCAADLNGDGAVDDNDLAALLGAWGPCP